MDQETLLRMAESKKREAKLKRDIQTLRRATAIVLETDPRDGTTSTNDKIAEIYGLQAECVSVTASYEASRKRAQANKGT